MQETKICTKCKQEKPLNQFGAASGNNGNNFRVQEVTYKNWCKTCVAEYACNWRKKNPGYRGSGKINQFPEEDRLLVSALSLRMNHAWQRYRKGKTSIEPDLDIEYLYKLYKEQNGKCALSGVDLKIEMHKPTTISLDKVEPEKGYIKGNVQWVAWAVNRAKGEMPQAMFINMCKKVIAKCND